jgi:hypothetical protein
MGAAERRNPLSLRNFPLSDRDVVDRFGRPLAVGDPVSIPTIPDTFWRVTDISTPVDPKIPAGHKVLQLTAVAAVLAQCGPPQANLVLVLPHVEAPPPPAASTEEKVTPSGLVLP